MSKNSMHSSSSKSEVIVLKVIEDDPANLSIDESLNDSFHEEANQKNELKDDKVFSTKINTDIEAVMQSLVVQPQA